MSAAQGGKFWAGFAAGALSSIASSAIQMGSTGINTDGTDCVTNFGATMNKPAIILATGAIMGGAGSAIGGGNFWQGAVTGLVVAGFNHLMHQMDSTDPPNKYKRYFQNKLRQSERFYDNNKVGLRQFFDGAEIVGGTMEIVGFVAAPFTEGASLVISAEGAFISGFGTGGNMAMDAIEGKWDSFSWRGIQFGAGLGMGRAFNHLPQTAGYLINAFKSFSETYVMPVLEDSWNKFNTHQNKPMQVTMPNRLKL
jgi:hypothetical protein